ncbi:hypothetical protein RB595_007857 [Gaeumannomyces hyphopodioides]
MKIDSSLIQEKMAEPIATGSRFRGSLNKDAAKFQAYKAKFLQGEANRKRLFADLKDCNEKLWKLLDSSEKDAQLTRQLEVAQAASVLDNSLCTFWKTATAFFRALAAACRCHCRAEHAARLLLQHRASCKEKSQFEMLFTIQTTEDNQQQPHPWEAFRTRIEEGNHGGFIRESHILIEKKTPCQTGQRSQLAATTTKVTLRARGGETPAQKAKVQFTPAVLLDTPSRGPDTPQFRPISTLCKSLCSPKTSCQGYLDLPDEDRRYYVYSVAQHAKVPPSVTLRQILNKDVKPLPTRRESYAIALIIASSFLQLADSPWLPNAGSGHHSFANSSLIFLADPSNPNVFLLHQPHINRDFSVIAADGETNSTTNAARRGDIGPSLERLGITLLELCFRAPLEQQPCRALWPSGGSGQERDGYDFLAAKDWLREVNDEAGSEYAAAVSWCLLGNATAPADKWRSEMLNEVVRPLQRCLDCFGLAGSV